MTKSILGVLVLFLVGCSDPRVGQCKESVERYLTAPGGAEWGDVELDEESDFFEILGYVDSQNTFGANERRYYVCHFRDYGPIVVGFHLDNRPVKPYRIRKNKASMMQWSTGVRGELKIGGATPK